MASTGGDDDGGTTECHIYRIRGNHYPRHSRQAEIHSHEARQPLPARPIPAWPDFFTHGSANTVTSNHDNSFAIHPPPLGYCFVPAHRKNDTDHDRGLCDSPDVGLLFWYHVERDCFGHGIAIHRPSNYFRSSEKPTGA